jgi:hypothetical protein
MNWQLHDISGTPKEAIDSVEGNKTLPEAAKAFLGHELRSLPKEAKLCRLDAYSQQVPSPRERKTLCNIQISLVAWA